MNRYSAYLHRLADYHDGRGPPDARDDEMRDQGAELQWRSGVRRRELERCEVGQLIGQYPFVEQPAAARAEP